jgi:hypothetical protein
MSANQAIVEANKVFQRENEYVRSYIARFEEYRQFFKDMVDNTMVVEMFLENTRGEIRRRAVEISARQFSWEEMLNHVQILDNQAPRLSRPPQVANPKRSMMNVGKTDDFPQAEEDEGCNTPSALRTQIADLQSMVAQLENTVKETSGGSDQSRKRRRRSDTVCYNCDKKGHLSRNCRQPRRDNKDQGKGVRK